MDVSRVQRRARSRLYAVLPPSSWRLRKPRMQYQISSGISGRMNCRARLTLASCDRVRFRTGARVVVAAADALRRCLHMPGATRERKARKRKE